MMNRDRLRQFLVIFFMIGQWATTAAIFTTFTEDISTGYDDYFIPSDGTFAIWGAIYLTSTLYAVYQALPAQRERRLHRRVGPWLAGNYALCSLWNLVSVQSGTYDSPNFQPGFIVATVVIIILMLLTMTRAFVLLRSSDAELSRADRAFVQVPHAIYFAWLNVATIANTASALVAYGFTGEPNGALWAAGMIVVAIVLTSLMVLYSRPSAGTIAYTTVIVWTFAGVFIGNNSQSALVGTLALIGAGVIILVTTLHFANQQRTRQTSAAPQSPATAR